MFIETRGVVHFDSVRKKVTVSNSFRNTTFEGNKMCGAHMKFDFGAICCYFMYVYTLYEL